MGSIIGIPSTRVSDTFIRQRLVNQMLSDQLELLRIQTQLSTGRRIQRPSEDADAALRIISLQRLLERKEQVQTNLRTNQSYLTATDTALSTVSSSLAEARGVALGAIGTTASETQRETAALQVQETIRQLLDVGNEKFRGRYLFAGTGTSVRPFETTGANLVQYLGDEGRLSSYSDVGVLFDTNLPGSEVFGAISQPVLGTVDLDPILTFDTRLADLRGGLGITRGSIAISNGSSTSTIDLSLAETIGDAAALIRANSGAIALDVEVTRSGLTIAGAPGELLTIREVGGTTAEELGILATTPTGTIAGSDLDPVLRLTTRLDDVLGTRSYAVVRSSGADNDIIFEADTVGAASNEIQIVFDDDPSVVVIPGTEEVASYDPFSLPPTLTVTVKAGGTQARHVVAAVEAAYDPVTFPFTARLDPLDEQSGGRGIIEPGGTATSSGSGTAFDKQSGLQIQNGGTTHVLSFADAVTVEDVLNTLNASEVGLLAEINADATGIDVRSRLSGGDFMIGENGGDTATRLGLRTFTEATRLEDLNFGRGVSTHTGTDFTITIASTLTGPAADPIEIDVSGLETIGEVLDLIRSKDPANLQARLATYGNGIELVDLSTGTNTLTVSKYNLSRAAVDLGLVPEGKESYSAAAPLPVSSAAPKSNLIFTADNPGADVDGVRVVFENSGSGTVIYDEGAKTLTFGITTAPPAAATTAADIITWLEASPAGALFTAELDPADTANDGTGEVEDTDPLNPPALSDEGGTEATVTVQFSGTDNDLILGAVAHLPAQVGTEIQFNGVAGFGAPAFNYAGPGNPLIITYDSNGTRAQEIVDGLAADLGLAGATFTATLDPTDGSPNLGTGTVDSQTSSPMAGGSRFLTGSDVNPLETEGIFTALVRLHASLKANDLPGISRAIELLDQRMEEMNFSRAELGARQQGLDSVQLRLESENVDLQAVLSEDLDADLVEVISNLTARQIAFEAAMKSTASILQMTLLDYL